MALASIGIVHPDVRPGYDFTSNILLRLPADEEDRRAVDRFLGREAIP